MSPTALTANLVLGCTFLRLCPPDHQDLEQGQEEEGWFPTQIGNPDWGVPQVGLCLLLLLGKGNGSGEALACAPPFQSLGTNFSSWAGQLTTSTV